MTQSVYTDHDPPQAITLYDGLTCAVPSTSTLPCSMAAWIFDLVVLGMLLVRKASSRVPLTAA